MNRAEFEVLRDIPEKVISGDIRFARRSATAPALIADGIVIDNAQGVVLKLNIAFNPETGSKTFNVHIPGLGPICRLDVDGTAHGDAGRSHKHSLKSERCPDRNLPDGVVPREDLSGRTLSQVFAEFCRIANIIHTGTFTVPPEAA